MALLAEEFMDLTVEELINDYGADFIVQEHWYGLEFSLKLGGTVLYSAPYDAPLGAEDHFIIYDNEGYTFDG